MCQKLPRPRCSKHTYDRYAKEQALYEKIAASSSSGKKREVLERLHQQKQRVEEAQREYNASPEGLRQLEEKIADARKRRARGDLDEYLWQREVALKDAAEHKLAGKIYDRAGEGLRNPKDDLNLSRAYEYERLANAKLAERINNGASPRDISIARSVADKAKTVRISQEHAFVQRASGISPNSSKSVVEVSRIPQQEEGWSTYTYIPPTEFNKVSEYFPLGAYARVDSVRKDQYGNFVLSLEGERDILVPGTKKVLAVKGD